MWCIVRQKHTKNQRRGSVSKQSHIACIDLQLIERVDHCSYPKHWLVLLASQILTREV